MCTLAATPAGSIKAPSNIFVSLHAARTHSQHTERFANCVDYCPCTISTPKTLILQAKFAALQQRGQLCGWVGSPRP